MIDMAINTKKSSCVRIGPRNDNVCAKLTMCDGSELSWVDEIRYLGVFVTRARKFKCSITLSVPSTVPLTVFLVKLGD